MAQISNLKLVKVKSMRECWKGVNVMDCNTNLDDSTSFLDKAALAA
jgi:hypothetical protein